MPPKKSSTDLDKKTFEEITFLILGLILLGAVATALLNYVDSLRLGAGISNNWWESLLNYFFEHIWPVWKFIAVVLAGFALWGIINNAIKLKAINMAEQLIYSPVVLGAPSDDVLVAETKNSRWEKIVAYSNSKSDSDWRLAIMEADIMLEELLKKSGYPGGSVGEMLKAVDRNEFSTIDSAWEAHKARNSIAHSGGDFQLNERETKRIISLFKEVFVEFGVI